MKTDRREFLFTTAAAAASAVVPQQLPASAPETALYAAISLDHLKGGLPGISAAQIEQHAKLYQGYVARTNALLGKIDKLVREGHHLAPDTKAPTPEYSELKRRYGFELNGMVLHEHYFQNLKPGQGGDPAGTPLAKRAERDFGSVQTWWSDFLATAKMTGVGWAVCCQDPRSGRLANAWVTEHEQGNVAGWPVVLACDVWEHAFMVDYAATERGKYLTAFEKSVDWDAAAKRLRDVPH
ncbi:MAG TPA: Fe-Mn family superoxide dismutase [Planctomycetota bacterium]|nr:Fe-Mn family superoxide dismutase [Planctomycetota bacterium]